MTLNFIRMSDRLELSAPVAVGMILIAAALAKGGHSFWAIGSVVAIHALSMAARAALARFNNRPADQTAEIESAPATSRPTLSLVPTAPLMSSVPASPVPPRGPRPAAASQAPLRQAA